MTQIQDTVSNTMCYVRCTTPSLSDLLNEFQCVDYSQFRPKLEVRLPVVPVRGSESGLGTTRVCTLGPLPGRLRGLSFRDPFWDTVDESLGSLLRLYECRFHTTRSSSIRRVRFFFRLPTPPPTRKQSRREGPTTVECA